MARRYYSYTQGNGPWHILGLRADVDDDDLIENERAMRRTHGQAWGRGGFRDPDLMNEFGPYPPSDHSVYSDRMCQQDREKYEAARERACGGKPFYHCTQEELSQFLTLYYGKPQEFVALWQGNNASNGFEYWVFFFDDPITEEDFA